MLSELDIQRGCNVPLGREDDVLRAESPCEKGAQLVRGDRQDCYGHPLDNHIRIARFWTARLVEKLLPGEVIEPHEVAACMRLTKEARLMHTRGHADSLDDIAGYADVEFLIHDEEARRGA